MGTKDGTEDGKAAGLARRDMLKGAALAGAGAAAAVVATGEAEAADPENQDQQVKARYRETDHVKRFYFLNSL